jgi:uncharacterized protein YjbI with pentapeptide repeats
MTQVNITQANITQANMTQANIEANFARANLEPTDLAVISALISTAGKGVHVDYSQSQLYAQR